MDHVSNYKIPKQGKKTDAETKKLYEEGCAPKAVPVQVAIKGPIKADPDDFRETLADQINSEIKLPARLPIYTVKKEKLDEEEEEAVPPGKKEKKKKKDKKKKKKKKKKSDSDSESEKSKKKNDSDSDYSAEDSESEEEDKRKRSRSPSKKRK